MLSATATARRARSTLTACSDCAAQRLDELLGSWPVADSHWLEVDALALELLDHVLDPVSAARRCTIDSGASIVDEFGQRRR